MDKLSVEKGSVDGVDTVQYGDGSGERADEPTGRSATTEHRVITSTILYFGTPVVLISPIQ